MRKLVYYVATTLDGFIAEPDRQDPTGRASFPITDDLIAFIVEHYPETLPAAARSAMGLDAPGTVFDTVLEGRGSYEVGLAAGVVDAYPHLRHLVFSTTLEDAPVEGPVGAPDGARGIEIVREDALGRVRELKREPGLDLWLVGGGRLAHALLPEIDRLVLKVSPTILGEGVPLFDGPFSPQSFVPAGEQPLPGGVRVVTYDRA